MRRILVIALIVASALLAVVAAYFARGTATAVQTMFYLALLGSAVTNKPAEVYLWSKPEAAAAEWLGEHRNADDVVLASTEFTDLPYPNRKVKFGDNGLNVYNKEVLAEWIKGELRTVWPKEVQAVAPLL